MEIIENLKLLISNFIENRQFTKMTTGTVVSVNPLKIKLNNEIELDESMVAITWTDELEPEFVGKKIYLLRQDGGGFYYALYRQVIQYKRKGEP